MRWTRCCWTWRIREPRRKPKYGGELFIANSGADPAGTQFLDFFQHDKTTGAAKGIVAIDPQSLR